MYEVLFGREGTVYSGRDKKRAFRKYRECCHIALNTEDQETVILYRNGDPICEFDPSESFVEVS